MYIMSLVDRAVVMTVHLSMGMVQVHAFPCSNVLYGANNVIFPSIQFISD